MGVPGYVASNLLRQPAYFDLPAGSQDALCHRNRPKPCRFPDANDVQTTYMTGSRRAAHGRQYTHQDDGNCQNQDSLAPAECDHPGHVHRRTRLQRPHQRGLPRVCRPGPGRRDSHPHPGRRLPDVHSRWLAPAVVPAPQLLGGPDVEQRNRAHAVREV